MIRLTAVSAALNSSRSAEGAVGRNAYEKTAIRTSVSAMMMKSASTRKTLNGPLHGFLSMARLLSLRVAALVSQDKRGGTAP